MESKEKNQLWIVWLMFGIFCVLFAANNIIAGANVTSRAWLLLEVWVFILDIILLATYKFPSKKYVYISCILGIAVMLTYIDMSVVEKDWNNLSIFIAPVLTALSAMASFRVFEKYPEKAIHIFKKNNKKSIVISILLGLAFGVVWGIINYILMNQNDEASFRFSIHCFLVSLSPAIMEEIAMRTIFYAFCASLMKDKEESQFYKFTFWFMMILPHVLVHAPEAYIEGGLISGLIVTALYVLIFGLIFAILQKKRDLASAMIAHGTVDFIRFCFFGLPF